MTSGSLNEERELICQRIISILELDESSSYMLCKLDADKEKQDRILEMKERIRRTFPVSQLSMFKPSRGCKRPYSSLIRVVLRTQGYEIHTRSVAVGFENDKVITSVLYTIRR